MLILIIKLNIDFIYRFFYLSIRYTSGTTHTGDAIKYARQTSFSTQNGMRPNAAKIAIIVTDGKILSFAVSNVKSEIKAIETFCEAYI